MTRSALTLLYYMRGTGETDTGRDTRDHVKRRGIGTSAIYRAISELVTLGLLGCEGRGFDEFNRPLLHIWIGGGRCWRNRST